MMLRLPSHIFGETDAVEIAVFERDRETFTIASATVTIKDSAGVVKRSAVACTVDNTHHRVKYQETFSTANGYAEGGGYIATFKITIGDYVIKTEGRFDVIAANDE